MGKRLSRIVKGLFKGEATGDDWQELELPSGRCVHTRMLQCNNENCGTLFELRWVSDVSALLVKAPYAVKCPNCGDLAATADYLEEVGHES